MEAISPLSKETQPEGPAEDSYLDEEDRDEEEEKRYDTQGQYAQIETSIMEENHTRQSTTEYLMPHETCVSESPREGDMRHSQLEEEPQSDSEHLEEAAEHKAIQSPIVPHCETDPILIERSVQLCAMLQNDNRRISLGRPSLSRPSTASSATSSITTASTL